ncbi:4Fe-4S ferredoxin N-terminal domain-containing protein [Halobacteriaceae archaeon GCM10025711]
MTSSDDPLEVAAEQSRKRAARGESYDPELGHEMAKDAIRVSHGELSDEAFYRKYHDRVLEEFGFDRRPMPEEDGDE